MTRSKKILIGAGAVVLIAGWYAFRPERLWIDKVVSEGFDTTSVALSGGAVAAASSSMPTMIAMGRFHGVAHDGMGLATIYRTADGKRTLRLTQFETSNGPELHLYLVAAPDAKDDATIKRAGFIDLGPLKGNKGDQNYEIADSVDVSRYGAVTVWCRRFGVNFTTAPLAVADMPAAAGAAAEPTPGGPSAIAAGSFHSNAHETKGAAAVYRRADGGRILRLSEFETSNGPDVRVYLVAAPDVQDDATVKRAGFVELGKLKGNKGDQNYEIPASVDLAKYRSVTIWCARFNVNFGTAPLSDRRG